MITDVQLEKLLKDKVFTSDDLDSFTAQLNRNSRGEWTGVMPPLDSPAYLKYAYACDLTDETTDDLEKLQLLVQEHCLPPLGAEYMHEIFYTFGYTYTGIADGWEWYTKETISARARKRGHKPIEEATAEECWKLLALTFRYWEVFYHRLSDER